MKKSLIALALAFPLVASANLLSNGSFESGLTGWTPNAAVAGELYPVAVLTYGPGAAFGEAVAADNAVSMSPDAAGAKATYFVDDLTTQTLTQTFVVAVAGLHNVGFSYYVPANGLGNPNGSSFGATVDSTVLQSTSVSGPAQTWNAINSTLNLGVGSHTFTFTFTPTGVSAEDVVIDRAFVTAVPEPETFALMLAGLAGIGFMARRRRG